ncbi:MAG: GIY-YIG nuclease family protein [Patescibacteria group bacterium]|jgi:putative endonuclease|nr:GIY-YIG nuclease family protein [Patescibacteria group bacterium]
MYYVYILRCNDDKIYTGCTKDLRDRIYRHKKGYVSATADRVPIRLINYVAFRNKYKAYEFEKYLKSGSGRSFIKRHF